MNDSMSHNGAVIDLGLPSAADLDAVALEAKATSDTDDWGPDSFRATFRKFMDLMGKSLASEV